MSDHIKIKESFLKGSGLEFMNSLAQSDDHLYHTLKLTINAYRHYYREEGLIKFDNAIASLLDLKISNNDIDTLLLYSRPSAIDRVLPMGRDTVLKFVDKINESNIKKSMLPSEKTANHLLNEIVPELHPVLRTAEMRSQPDYHDLHDYRMIRALGEILLMCGWNGKDDCKGIKLFTKLIDTLVSMKLPNAVVNRIAFTGSGKTTITSLLSMDRESIIELFKE